VGQKAEKRRDKMVTYKEYERRTRVDEYFGLIRAHIADGHYDPSYLFIEEKRQLVAAYLESQSELSVEDLMTAIPASAFVSWLAATSRLGQRPRYLVHADELLIDHFFQACEGDIRRDFEIASEKMWEEGEICEQ
jgi:hypothetical protein